jgi:phage FluMu protein Com
VAIQFRCPACDRRLSIASRKAGARIACPSCKGSVSVPGAPPTDADTEDAAPGNGRALLVTAAVAVLLFGGLALALTFALQNKPAPQEVEQSRAEPALVQPTPAKPQAAQNPQPKQQPQQPLPQLPQQPEPQQPQPEPMVTPPAVSPGPQAQAPEPAPPPRPVAVAPPVPQAPAPLDKFGNPVGPSIGLGKDGEFKGKKLLFWCAFENAGRVFFHQTNPLWKALEAKGFVVSPVFGRFNPAWLKEADQLWIVSSGQFQIPQLVTPDDLVAAVSLLPAAAIPSGFTVQEYQFIVKATLDVALSTRHQLDEKAYKAIEDFVKAGKGLCLLAEDEPFTAEADELARRLFGARVSGNYIADKTAGVRGRALPPAAAQQFRPHFEVDPHPLLTDVNHLFEGITVSNVSKSDKLEVAMRASDGKTLIAVSKVAGQRVVIDCGFTRYCHGPTERTSYIQKTAGTVRLAQNIAAYLAGKDKP